MNIDHADYAEIIRLLLNLIRFGVIAEADYDNPRVRVNVGGNITNWRPWAAHRAGDTQTWCPPSVGEQVILFSPEGDFNQSVAFPAIYSDQAKPPSSNPAHHTTKYRDGAVIQYDSDAHALTATLPSGSRAVVKADQVTSDAPDTVCTGNLTVAKNLIVNGMSQLNAGMAVQPGEGGRAATIQGKLTVSDDVVISGMSVTGHKHFVVAVGADSEVPK
jgi:phage baseplate assembly protein V